VVGDVDGDGKDEVVFGTSTGNALFVYGVTPEGWCSQSVLTVPGTNAIIKSVSLADFDGDGMLDIAAGTSPFDDVVLFTSESSGEYLMTSYTIGVNSTYSIAADFNHDGKADLAFRNYEYQYKPPTVSVLLHK
jgi:hypothetical protein